MIDNEANRDASNSNTWSKDSYKSTPQTRFYSKRKNRLTPILYYPTDSGE
jgi:hypothetical protein